MTSLPRVMPGLLRHQLDEQVLVYDSRGDRVHLLDPTTACVLALLEEGGWTREGIAAELQSRLGVTCSSEMLLLALDELRAADLLEPASKRAAPAIDVGRRELLRKIGLTGAAALLVPAIVTFTATPGYAASAGGALGHCVACTGANPSTSCGPGLVCYLGNGSPGYCVTPPCVSRLGTCTSSPNCCSDQCTTGNRCPSGTCNQ